MSHGIPGSCYRCGASLAALTPPLSRQDECAACGVYLHVCRMCKFFREDVPRQCLEDGAEEVVEKERPNFCDWFRPSATAFDPRRAANEAKAKDSLAVLFGDASSADEGGGGDDPDLSAAEDLFK